jgi:hypothetical protein
VAKKQSAAVEATRLLGRWTKLAQGHVMFGAGCSCGLGFAGMRLADFEPQILDFLRSRHGAGGATSIPHLLRGIVTRGQEESGDLALLADLERSIDSFDELHRRGASA